MYRKQAEQLADREQPISFLTADKARLMSEVNKPSDDSVPWTQEKVQDYWLKEVEPKIDKAIKDAEERAFAHSLNRTHAKQLAKFGKTLGYKIYVPGRNNDFIMIEWPNFWKRYGSVILIIFLFIICAIAITVAALHDLGYILQ